MADRKAADSISLPVRTCCASEGAGSCCREGGSEMGPAASCGSATALTAGRDWTDGEELEPAAKG